MRIRKHSGGDLLNRTLTCKNLSRLGSKDIFQSISISLRSSRINSTYSPGRSNSEEADRALLEIGGNGVFAVDLVVRIARFDRPVDRARINRTADPSSAALAVVLLIVTSFLVAATKFDRAHTKSITCTRQESILGAEAREHRLKNDDLKRDLRWSEEAMERERKALAEDQTWKQLAESLLVKQRILLDEKKAWRRSQQNAAEGS
ncbi:hypothetical protein R1sor_023875 [Riccia sorocarpa]|uniref:Uncharacterized protein n=1 Tax=Riccia sorocarpa TaxID=122646 RepID=A0ABD3GSY9_9MARC